MSRPEYRFTNYVIILGVGVVGRVRAMIIYILVTGGRIEQHVHAPLTVKNTGLCNTATKPTCDACLV